MTSELMPNLPDRVCIWDADNNDPTSTRGWTTSFSEGHQNIYVRANENTRTVPDVPELVRYQPIVVTWEDGSPKTTEMVVIKDGEYVRHDQAVTVIAALLEQNARLIKDGLQTCDELEHIHSLWKADKAELAQIEKQDANIYIDRYTDDEGNTTLVTLVASDSQLRAENDKLREALEAQDELSRIGLFNADPDFIEKVKRLRKAALNPSEPKS